MAGDTSARRSGGARRSRIPGPQCNGTKRANRSRSPIPARLMTARGANGEGACTGLVVGSGHRQLGAGLGGEGRDGSVAGMTPTAKSPYAGYRFPGEVISHAVWLYFRFPLSLRMVEEMLAARGIDVSHETVRQWARKFGQAFANQIRRRLPCAGDKWHLDEVCLMIAGKKHWLWRAVD